MKKKHTWLKTERNKQRYWKQCHLTLRSIRKSWAALVSRYTSQACPQQTQDTIFCRQRKHGAMWHVRFGMEIKCHDATRERYTYGYFAEISSPLPTKFNALYWSLSYWQTKVKSWWSNPILMTNKWESFGWMDALIGLKPGKKY